MNDINFFSESTYLFLPSKKNPKVALAVDNNKVARNAFKLYNPFSRRTKILKNIATKLYVNWNTLANKLNKGNSKSNSDFIQYLEHKLGVTFISSVYFATAKDKVVIQLQSKNKIYGYLKFPLNDIGISRLLNEKKAIDVLSQQGIVAPVLLFDSYKKKPFILLKEVKGEIQTVNKGKLDAVLFSFKKENSYQLNKHPRVLQLLEKLNINGLPNYKEIIHTICNRSQKEYYEVYEHGDFAPWNLVTNSQKVIPFDFEYFEENGIEYFDIIKYYYQTGRLLQQLSKVKLIAFIYKTIETPEIELLFQLFLINEIVTQKSNNNPYVFEKELLDYIQHEKT